MSDSERGWWRGSGARRTLLVFLIGAVLGFIGQWLVFNVLHDLHYRAELRGLERAAGDAHVVSLEYAFLEETRTVTVGLSDDALDSAREVRVPQSDSYRIIGNQIRAAVESAARSDVVREICAQADEVVAAEGLSKDEHLELLASIVQHMRYNDEPREGLMTPVNALARGERDCMEGSILLAALLVHEGYECAVLGVADHAVAAVASDDRGRLLGTRWAPIETTHPMLVGEVSTMLSPDGGPVDLLVTVEFPGEKTYCAGDQVGYILQCRVQALELLGTLPDDTDEVVQEYLRAAVGFTVSASTRRAQTYEVLKQSHALRTLDRLRGNHMPQNDMIPLGDIRETRDF